MCRCYRLDPDSGVRKLKHSQSGLSGHSSSVESTRVLQNSACKHGHLSPPRNIYPAGLRGFGAKLRPNFPQTVAVVGRTQNDRVDVNRLVLHGTTSYCLVSPQYFLSTLLSCLFFTISPSPIILKMYY